MTIEETNKRALRTGFPELYDRLVQVERGGKEPASTDENPVVQIEERQSRFSDVSALVLHMKNGDTIRLNSEYDPAHEAEVWMDGQEPPTASYYLIFGLGNGVFAREIVKRIGADKPVLIYEPSREVFLWSLAHYELGDFFSNRVRVIVEGINEDLFMAVMETMIDYENYKEYQIYLTPQTATVFPESRERFVRHFAADGIGWIEGNITTEREELYISPLNQLRNLRFLENGTVVPKLKPTMPRDIPVLLVGAAPSLAGEIDTIQKFRDKVYIFAADSACAFLMENDIMPDAFMAVEPDRPLSSYRDERIRDIPMFCKMNTSWKLLDWHRERKIFGYDDSPFIQSFYKRHGVTMSQYRYGGNTMTALFAICDELGVEDVMLVGQDMCFDEEGNTHVDDTRSDTIDKSGDFVCENNEGRIVKTRYDWFTFLRWYESAIYDCSMKHVIQTSLKGAKVAGAEVMSLEDAIRKYGREHEPFSDVLARTKGAYQPGRVPELPMEYHRWEKELDEIQDIVAKGPRDERRKEREIYGLLRKYEMVDEKEDFALSQEDGIEKLRGFIRECMEQDQK